MARACYEDGFPCAGRRARFRPNNKTQYAIGDEADLTIQGFPTLDLAEGDGRSVTALADHGVGVGIHRRQCGREQDLSEVGLEPE